MTEINAGQTMAKTVLICCHKTCPQQGAIAVLREFQKYEQDHPATLTVIRAGCLGECGNGPMVKIMPDKVWYAHVQPQDVPTIYQQHLCQGKPLRRKLYRKFHQEDAKVTVWILVFLVFWAFIIALFGILGRYTEAF